MLDEGRGLRDTLRLALVAIGRGGQGDVGSASATRSSMCNPRTTQRCMRLTIP